MDSYKSVDQYDDVDGSDEYAERIYTTARKQMLFQFPYRMVGRWTVGGSSYWQNFASKCRQLSRLWKKIDKTPNYWMINNAIDMMNRNNWFFFVSVGFWLFIQFPCRVIDRSTVEINAEKLNWVPNTVLVAGENWQNVKWLLGKQLNRYDEYAK